MNAALRAELARRMPALNAGMIALRQGRNVDLAAAIRDAHTLASGSALLGETSAAAALRRVESELATPQAKRDVHVIAEQLTVAWLALSTWLPVTAHPVDLEVGAASAVGAGTPPHQPAGGETPSPRPAGRAARQT